MVNHSELPTSISSRTDKRLSPVTFSGEDIGKINQDLDYNKAHWHDNIKVRMLKICDDTKSSHQSRSVKKDVLRNFKKFTGKHLYQSLFFNKVPGWPVNLLKKRLRHLYFPVNFVKFLRTPYLQNTSGRLLL